MTCTIDDRDRSIVAERMTALDARVGPRVGDYVRFSDGTERRISYHWRDDAGWDGGCQTSDGGSYHLGAHGVSMSGALYSTVPTAELVQVDEVKPADVWIFHHGMAGAHRGVHFAVDFRVFTFDGPAPR